MKQFSFKHNATNTWDDRYYDWNYYACRKGFVDVKDELNGLNFYTSSKYQFDYLLKCIKGSGSFFLLVRPNHDSESEFMLPDTCNTDVLDDPNVEVLAVNLSVACGQITRINSSAHYEEYSTARAMNAAWKPLNDMLDHKMPENKEPNFVVEMNHAHYYRVIPEMYEKHEADTNITVRVINQKLVFHVLSREALETLDEAIRSRSYEVALIKGVNGYCLLPKSDTSSDKRLNINTGIWTHVKDAVKLPQEHTAVSPKHYKSYIGNAQWLEAMSQIPTLRDPEKFSAAVELQVRKYLDRNGQKDEEIQELLKAHWYLEYLIAYKIVGSTVAVNDVKDIISNYKTK